MAPISVHFHTSAGTERVVRNVKSTAGHQRYHPMSKLIF
ncbi:IS1 family transposase [Mixta hanseatica]|uniref:InsA N-terminal zinc ribbon domain-containing protein n=1 Tax=Mixta hanseatica TaxID=2872648 RepID=A0ABY4RDY7_9GAMM|nr:hypothetical protein K6958_21045 [Mixta hanseatica]